jgi:hypothetical protein
MRQGITEYLVVPVPFFSFVYVCSDHSKRSAAQKGILNISKRYALDAERYAQENRYAQDTEDTLKERYTQDLKEVGVSDAAC